MAHFIDPIRLEVCQKDRFIKFIDVILNMSSLIKMVLLYRILLKLVTILSTQSSGTVSVSVSDNYNAIAFEGFSQRFLPICEGLGKVASFDSSQSMR